MQRGIFTKIGAGNPVKTPSDAVNSKPACFIRRPTDLEIAAARTAFGQFANRLAKFAQAGADFVDLAFAVRRRFWTGGACGRSGHVGCPERGRVWACGSGMASRRLSGLPRLLPAVIPDLLPLGMRLRVARPGPIGCSGIGRGGSGHWAARGLASDCRVASAFFAVDVLPGRTLRIADNSAGTEPERSVRAASSRWSGRRRSPICLVFEPPLVRLAARARSGGFTQAFIGAAHGAEADAGGEAQQQAGKRHHGARRSVWLRAGVEPGQSH